MEATLQAFFCEILSVVVAVQVVCMRMLWLRVNELQWQLVMDETRVITQYLQVNMMTRVRRCCVVIKVTCFSFQREFRLDQNP